jgi:hypothetical protein
LNNFFIISFFTTGIEAEIVIKKNLVLFRSDDKLRKELGSLVSSEEMPWELGKKSSDLNSVRSIALPVWVVTILQAETSPS